MTSAAVPTSHTLGDGTGRIRKPLHPRARRLVFGPAEAADLELITEVDRAHLVMLAEEGLIERRDAALILAEVDRLRRAGFAALAGRESRRGVYFLYEDWLAERLGEPVAGRLRTGRSRNDLNATRFLLGLRQPFQHFTAAGLRLQAVLLRAARRHAAVVMPAYTHHQPAFPTTLGHYLAGVATALDRDLSAVEEAGAGLGRCPLGAGAGGGTALPLRPARTAALLGFDGPCGHSLDAVAAREPALRLLAAASVLGVTLSRLGCDLTTWTTAEYAFLRLGDELVGSSSLMPQKRNPFLLEHVKGRAAAPLGAFVAAAQAMHATPFANSIAVGTEGCAPLTAALDAAAGAADILALVVAGARPQPAAMLDRAEAGQVTATAAAERLAATGGLSFREAHRRVGEAITSGRDPLALDDPATAVAAARHGNGPGRPPALEELRARWVHRAAAHRDRRRRWRDAAADLDAAVSALGGSG